MAYSPPGTGNSYQHEYNHMIAVNEPDRAPSSGSAEDGPEEYVVKVHAQPVAPVDEDGQTTTHRALTANQVTMITLGGTFGTGLLVATGTSLYDGGPLGIVIAFSFVGFICYCVMTSLCEMATYLPHKKGFVGYVSRYVHPAVGFSLGWTYLCQFVFVPASHINTASISMEYAAFNVDASGNPIGHFLPVPKAVWRLIFTIIVILLNLLPIRGFGRVEFWLSTFKIFVLIALIMFGLVVDLGGARLKTGGYDRLGFRFWGHPYGPMGHAPMSPNGEPLSNGDTNRFLGWWATMVGTWFSYMGIELIGVVVGEAANPRVSVPKAIKRTYRIVFTLYILGSIITGLICNSNAPPLYSSDPKVSHNGQTSPFMIAAYQLAAKGLVPVISAAIVVFALSGATSNIYTGSRLLYGMTLDKQAPQILRKVTAGGRPLMALAACSVWSFLSYAGEDESSTNEAFGYFTDLTSTAGAIAWICILWAHIRFRMALKAQFQQLDTLRYISPMYPYGTYFALFFTIVFTIFKGHASYIDRKVPGVIVAYIMAVVFLVLIGFWKWLHNETATPVERIDLREGKIEIDLEEENYQMRKARQPPKPWFKRVMSQIA